ncbi:hypothetical protein [Pseudoduganella namucuonensis]|uniref:Tetratricopeptide repeat protein n=1 Tax=Pseudoduganella namucuonensis TaxID=1035707 RepID=A0A1I7JGY1_9BURK|nr:hypothetical protein [Pseudoduganella namucuonensis]SFU84423.1 hypothetical protein SAMN05216552_1011130 [Pseudoduganella namucuonensis]
MKPLTLIALGLCALQAAAAPYVPASGAQVIETLPRRSDPGQQELLRMRARLAANPKDPATAAALARRYIAIGRGASDPRYNGYAQAALAPWWTQPAPPTEVRILRATLNQSTHRYAEALADLEAVTKAAPGEPQAWLTRATVQTVVGDYGGATASCARLSSLADELVATTCLANTASITGRLAPSIRLLDAIHLRGAGAPAELRAWSLTLLAELCERHGDAAGAEARYRQALAISPDDGYLLGAYADFLLVQERPREVTALLRDHGRVDPLLLRHALALKLGGESPAQLADARRELAARFDAALRRGDSVHQREQARYELHLRGDTAAALALAKKNWAVQKEPADARLLLEAALAARDIAAARPVLRWMADTGFEDRQAAALAARLGKAS